MSRRVVWTATMDAALKECVKAGLTGGETGTFLDQSPDAVYRRARKLDLNFDSAPHGDLRKFLAHGGRLIREEWGGAVGVRWGRAHRSGAGFGTAICETLLKYGVLVADGANFRRKGA